MKIEQREKLGSWMIWFPKSTKAYEGGPIKAKTDKQALASWLMSDFDKKWFNNIFRDYRSKGVVYKGRKYTKDEGGLLYKKIVENDDWEAVNLSDVTNEKKSKLVFCASLMLLRDSQE